jgi:hypothetical protein
MLMARCMKTFILPLMALLWPVLANAQARKVEVPHSEQTIGSWVLSCEMDPMTDGQVCRMRHKLWLVVPGNGHPGMALEVQLRGDHFVPVITVRDLTLSSALSGLLALTATAQIRFDNAPMVEMPCSLDGTSVMCSPTKSDPAAALAQELPKAKTVLVRFRSVGNLPLPVPDGPLALDLDQTQEALARYRLAGPEVAPSQTSLGDDIRNSADTLLRSLGLGGGSKPNQPK